MCSIAGFISDKLGPQDLQGMNRVLKHRGPDASGIYHEPSTGLGLAHNRLSILDLTASGNQPFHSRDGRFVMVYNGEVYNYKEIAARYGITAATGSDTEIIIEAFAKVGLDCLGDLNGMFALAIWDKVDQKLYLVRDRIGVKPLYYYWDGTRLLFASELKAIVPSSRQVYRPAVSDYLYLGYIPGEATIYEHCRKLRPGHFAVWSKGRLETGTYWRLEDRLSKEILRDEAEAKSALKDLLESSVRYCLIADVPTGVLLSGGVDSSIVAAAAQSVSTSRVKTFSIGFAEAGFNEAGFARQVSEHLGTEHHEYVVTSKDAMQLMEEIIDIYDEPYADASAIPTMMVSRLARKEVTVALSGDGGDELFMGYGFYQWARRLSHPMWKVIRKPVAMTLHTLGNNRLKRGAQMFRYPSEARIKSHIFSQEQYNFTESEINEMLCTPTPLSLEEAIRSDVRPFSLAETQSLFDIQHYLPEELLVKVDRASMRHSLEMRVPLLDHRLVEFAVNLSESLRLKGPTGKYLLKQVLYDYLPPALFDRPKRGFSIPLGRWLATDLRYLIDIFLADDVIQQVGLVHPAAVRRLKTAFLKEGRTYLYNRLWLLILLHKWMLEKS